MGSRGRQRTSAKARRRSTPGSPIRDSRKQLAAAVRKAAPRYDALLRSPEWRRLGTIAADLGLEHGLELPTLYVDWDDGRACFGDETKKRPGFACSDDYNWYLGSSLVLGHVIDAKQYRCHYDLARFDRFADLALTPAIGRSQMTILLGGAGERSESIVLLQQQAAVVLCTRRLVEIVEEGRLVDVVAAEMGRHVAAGRRL